MRPLNSSKAKFSTNRVTGKIYEECPQVFPYTSFVGALFMAGYLKMSRLNLIRPFFYEIGRPPKSFSFPKFQNFVANAYYVWHPYTELVQFRQLCMIECGGLSRFNQLQPQRHS